MPPHALAPPNPAASTDKQDFPIAGGGFLIQLNAKHQIFDEQDKGQRFNMRRLIDVMPSAVIDLRTMRAAEIIKLFQAVNHTITRVGAARLFLSVQNPAFSLAQVQDRQGSIQELIANPGLHREIVAFLSDFGKREDDLFCFLNAHTHPMVAYEDYCRAREAISALLRSAQTLPRPQSGYLRRLLEQVLALQEAPDWQLFLGPAFRTFSGIKTRGEKGRLAPAWSFHPRHLSLGSLGPSLPGLYFGGVWFTGLMNPTLAQSLFLSTSWLGALGLAYGWLLKPLIDFDTALLPIRQRLLESTAFSKTIEAAAVIDELASLVTYSGKMSHPVVLPTVTEAISHSFVAKDLRNPILALTDPDYVANDVDLAGQHITFITGPNSGGKTTYCKTIVQNQILAQIGGPVVATAASVTIADRIIYQAPNFDSLNDEEGRFGTELKTTRDIFYSVSPKSLAILDEIAEGTTSHEKLSFSTDIMHGFYAIGNSTLLVTHSYELVDHFSEQNKGAFLMMSVADGSSSHKITQGTSRDSNAERVAAKIGFSRQDMRDYLREKGYLHD